MRTSVKMTANVTVEDEGKDVIDANGDRIGTVSAVDDGTALVDPVSEINTTVRRALGWSDEPDVYPLREQSIDAITESTIHLRSNL